MITLLEIEGKLAELREKYRYSLYQDREIIKRRAKALLIAKEKLMKKRK